ncbi:DNA breaking-rejoining protein, partial [Serratia marcescens]|nr:DNA breaking-rejoining protein [Serratia marcescens]
NDTLPTPLKTSGNTDALLDQIYFHINPELYLAETHKPEPLRKPVKKDDLMQVIKEVNPDAVFEDEIISQWLSDDSKIHVQTVDYEMANNM